MQVGKINNIQYKMKSLFYFEQKYFKKSYIYRIISIIKNIYTNNATALIS